MPIAGSIKLLAAKRSVPQTLYMVANTDKRKTRLTHATRGHTWSQVTSCCGAVALLLKLYWCPPFCRKQCTARKSAAPGEAHDQMTKPKLSPVDATTTRTILRTPSLFTETPAPRLSAYTELRHVFYPDVNYPQRSLKSPPPLHLLTMDPTPPRSNTSHPSLQIAVEPGQPPPLPRVCVACSLCSFPC